MGWINVVTAFMASSPGTPEEEKAVKRIAKGLAARDKRVIYGGGPLGLMGTFAQASKDAGSPEVKAYIPTVLLDVVKDMEDGYEPIAHIEEEVASMEIRKFRMIKECQLAITFPGGSGSMEEFWQFIVTQELLSYSNPDDIVPQMILFNQDGAYDGTVKQIEDILARGKKHPEAYKGLHIVTSEDELLETIDYLEALPPLRGRDLLPESMRKPQPQPEAPARKLPGSQP